MKKITPIILIIIVTILLLATITTNNQKELRIVGAELPPFEYYENKQAQGIHIEIIKEILDKLEVPYTIELMEWDDALKKMKSGDAEIMPSVLYTKERSSYINYLDEHKTYTGKENLPKTTLWLENYIFFKKTDSNLDLSSVNSIVENNYRVAIINGYHYPKELYSEHFNFYSYRTAKEAIEGLNTNEIDILLSDKFPTEKIIKEMNLNINPSQEISYFAPNFIVFSKNSKYKNLDKIQEKFYEKLIELKNKNKHEELYQKYIGENFTKTYNL